ncbi:TonB-dependent receptor [Caulobacter mirabilis]|uniref:TonB-dependent receptor n=1 Tax=Caulobacter mirabilis TaxID=69666 RepID=A0A2D2AVY5_9CAUL|nr:TonB-dependent receptor [Caulobacter mirabilis]ATQ42164.1 TonB-dependent receptor [Caulobacter mirabilis]
MGDQGRSARGPRAWLAAGAGLMALAMAGTARAEDPAPAEVDAVVVTAQKRAQDTLDVGLNVSVVDAGALRQNRVTQISDLSAFTPNVDIKENMPGILPVVTIRGVGLNDFSATNNPSAGVYVDEVYLSSLALMNFDLFDLERMEALKGPQGTLYGRNSTAGAINIVTAKPSFGGYAARIAGGFGNYESADLDGWVNVPVSEIFALRFSGKLARQDEGFFFDRGRNDDIGRRDVKMVRAQARWAATEATDILLKAEAQQVRSQVGGPEFFGLLPPPGAPAGLVCPGSPGCMDFLGYRDTDGDPYKGAWSVDPTYDVDQRAVTLRMEHDFGWGTLTSVTGWVDFQRQWGADTDGGPFRQTDFVEHDDIQQISHELRLAGATEKTDWLVGAFISRDRVRMTYDGDLRDLFNTRTLTFTDQVSKSAAVFGNIEHDLTPTLSLIAGLRYTSEEKANIGGDYDLVSQCPGSALTGAPCGSPPILMAFVDETIDDQNWSWKLGLNWKPGPLTLIYASVSQGVKSGGFFSGVASNSAQLKPYEPETLVAWEAGVKQRLPAWGLSWSGSVFFYDYSDVQTFIRDISGTLPIQRLGNVGEATIYGLDLDARWTPTALPGLDVTAGLGLLHSELGGFIGSGGPVAKGNELPDAPPVSFNLAVGYSFDVGETLKARVQVDGRYADDMFKDAVNDPLIATEGYWVWNARASLFSGSDWEVAIWGKNLADEEYVTQGVNNLPLGVGFRVYGAPRTFGVSFSKSFQ